MIGQFFVAIGLLLLTFGIMFFVTFIQPPKTKQSKRSWEYSVDDFDSEKRK